MPKVLSAKYLSQEIYSLALKVCFRIFLLFSALFAYFVKSFGHPGKRVSFWEKRCNIIIWQFAARLEILPTWVKFLGNSNTDRVIMLNRPHTTVTNARNLKSVSQAKPPYFDGIFKLSTHEHLELPFLQIFIRFAHQSLTISRVKRPWNGFRFPGNFDVLCCLYRVIS